MELTDIKITFKKFGLNVPNSHRKVCYFPVINLEYDNCTKKTSICLRDMITDKSSIHRIVLGETYISLQIDNEFRVFNKKGEKIGSVKIDEYGDLFKSNKNSFILRKDRALTWISDKAEVIKTHYLKEKLLKTSEL